MKFVLMIYQGTTPLPGSEAWNALSTEEQGRIYAEYGELNKTPNMEPGLPMGLPGAAKTVQVRDGQPVIRSGTYLPEGAAGWMVFDADTVEEAIALAAKVPAARLGGAVEIRPVEQYW